MVTVTCQECGREIQLNEDYVESMVATGELARGNKRFQRVVNDVDKEGRLTGEQGEADHYVEKLFDLCKKCKVLNTVRPGDPEFERERRIQQKVRLLHEMRPDLDLEARVHAAVEDAFDPRNEPNEAFRNYLIERRGL